MGETGIDGKRGTTRQVCAEIRIEDGVPSRLDFKLQRPNHRRMDKREGTQQAKKQSGTKGGRTYCKFRKNGHGGGAPVRL